MGAVVNLRKPTNLRLDPLNAPVALTKPVLVVPKPEYRYAFLPMANVPRWWKPRLRKLSLGSFEGAMVRWSYHNGSTWTTVLFQGNRRHPNAIIGWAVFTLQEAKHPIIGVYVDEQHRKTGHGTELVRRLIDSCRDLVPHGKIYAVSDWWPKYEAIVETAGFRLLDWD